jgi:hypothetical protein
MRVLHFWVRLSMQIGLLNHLGIYELPRQISVDGVCAHESLLLEGDKPFRKLTMCRRAIPFTIKQPPAGASLS